MQERTTCLFTHVRYVYRSYSAMDHVEGVLAALTAGETSTGSGSAPAEAAQEQAVL